MTTGDLLQDEVLVIECNLDDSTGEDLGYVLDVLFEAGALDAWFTPITMKKSRPAVKLSVLCRPKDGADLRRTLLENTTTLGVRWQTWQRDLARRETDSVQTPWGAVRRKLKFLDDRLVGAKPEYEDCARLAREHGVSIHAVRLAASNVRESTADSEES